MTSGDMAGPLLGWLHFLHEPWQWPLGRLSQPMYELSNSLSLMDAVPLVSMLLKALGVPDGIYQFHGYWFLLCYLLQAHGAYLLMRLHYRDWQRIAFGMAFLCFSPILIYRVGHVSLCAHWIVLYSLYLSMRYQENNSKTFFLWASITLIGLMIHPYFILYTLTFAMLSFFRFLWDKERRRLPMIYLTSVLQLFLLLVLTYAVVYILGLNDQTLREKMVGGFHFYTSDVFMFFNSGGKSFLGPQLWEFRTGQYEGYAYLGLGIILLLFLVIYDRWGTNKKLWKQSYISSSTGPCLVAISLLTLFALGSNIRFFGKWLIDLRFLFDPFDQLLGPFRSNGRYIWAVVYFSIFVVVCTLPRRPQLQKKWKIILGLTLAIQLIDLTALRPSLKTSSMPSQQKLFAEIPLNAFQKIDVIPPQTNEVVCDGYQSNSFFVPFNVYAAANRIAINSSMRAHTPKEFFQDFCKKSILAVKNNKFDDKTIYVFQNQFLNKVKFERSLLRCQSIAGGEVCVLRSEQ